LNPKTRAQVCFQTGQKFILSKSCNSLHPYAKVSPSCPLGTNQSMKNVLFFKPRERKEEVEVKKREREKWEEEMENADFLLCIGENFSVLEISLRDIFPTVPKDFATKNRA